MDIDIDTINSNLCLANGQCSPCDAKVSFCSARARCDFSLTRFKNSEGKCHPNILLAVAVRASRYIFSSSGSAMGL